MYYFVYNCICIILLYLMCKPSIVSCSIPLPDSYFEYTLVQQPNTPEKPCNKFTLYSLQMKNGLSKENSVISYLVRIVFKKPLCIHYKNSMTPKKQLVT